ncbi:MAG: hypothetical protein LBC86_10235, partial [Oscillospiraceae bacterium]|nr:hypothetical protein [Oscillospiraceae bacterium]
NKIVLSAVEDWIFDVVDDWMESWVEFFEYTEIDSTVEITLDDFSYLYVRKGWGVLNEETEKYELEYFRPFN